MSVSPAKKRERFGLGTIRAIKSTIQEFASTTTIHGIAYLFDNARKAFDRILWIVAVCLGTGFAIILSLEAWIEWKDSPVLTSVSSTGLQIHTINFPAITICSQGLIKVIISESPMAEGIERWPCIPRVSGLIPGASNLKNC